jgi:hypothetical protein
MVRALILGTLASGCTADVDILEEDVAADEGPPSEDSGMGSGSAWDSSTSTTTFAGASWKILAHQYQAQQTGYWCGPAASRIVLSARIAPPSQQSLANQLPTTTNGTDWIGQVTRTLNANLGAARYATVEMPNDPPSPAQRDQLWRDVVRGIESNHPIVANIVAPPHNHPPGYPNRTIYHYFAVVGYNPQTREVHIADSANFSGINHYWLTLDKLASLIPPKGYSAYRCGSTMTGGLIDEKYRALGGCGSFLGAALTLETQTPDGVGRYNVFENGSIYWTPTTGAHEVHGAIRDKWKEVGWEAGVLGYPVSDEIRAPDGDGRYNVFENGSIYWTPRTGAHEVHGVIRDKWAELGWEAGALGYPISDEYEVPGGRQNDFERGSIRWDAATGVATAMIK